MVKAKKFRFPKVKHFKLTIFAILAVLICVAGYVLYKNVTGFKTFTLKNTNLADSKTQLVFSDANKVYDVNLDGSKPHEIASFPRNVNSIKVLKSGEVLVDIDYGYYVKYNADPSNKSTRQKATTEEENNHYYLIKNDLNTKKITPNQYSLYEQANENANNEIVKTEVLPNGTAKITSQTPESSPKVIGTMNKKLVAIGNEWGPPTYTYPYAFYPSFDGNLLLNMPPGGGGLGESGIVLSRNGQKSYDFNFYWYASSAIWIDNNKILSFSQENPLGISTIEDSGKITRIPLTNVDLGNFQQYQLSPDRKYIIYDEPHAALYVQKSNTLSVFNLEQQKSYVIVKSKNEKLNYKSESEVYTGLGFLGWSNNSDKLLYLVSATKPDGTVLAKEIRIYDLNQKKSYTIADLNSNLFEYGHPELRINNKPIADSSHFGIR